MGDSQDNVHWAGSLSLTEVMMTPHKYLQKLIDRAAKHLNVSPGRFLKSRPVIDDLLSYFGSGVPSLTQYYVDPSFPQYSRHGVITVGPKTLGVATVQQSSHPLAPAVVEAYITFDIFLDAEQDRPRWVDIKPDAHVQPLGSVGHTFTSALSLHQNLAEFGQLVLSPQQNTDQRRGPMGAEAWLAKHRMDRQP